MAPLRQFPATGFQPAVERGKVGKPGRRREQPFAHVADLILHLPLFPTGRRGAGHRLKQIMIGERQKAAVELAGLTAKDGFHGRLGVVVDQPTGVPTREGVGVHDPVDHLTRTRPGLFSTPCCPLCGVGYLRAGLKAHWEGGTYNLRRLCSLNACGVVAF